MHTLFNYRHIGIVYEFYYLKTVGDMVAAYYDNEMYDKCCFLLNGWYNKELIDAVKRQGYDKIILYNLEHIYLRGTDSFSDIDKWWNDDGYGWVSFEYADECWDFLLENRECYGKYEGKYRFMPMRYVGIEHYNTIPKPKYDVMFYGSLNSDCRCSMMKMFTAPHYYGWNVSENDHAKFLYSYGYGSCDIKDLLSISKYVLDYPKYSAEHNAQNTVRIFELLCRNKNVVSCYNTKRHINYFDDLVKVSHIDGHNVLNYGDIYSYVKNHDTFDVAERYKELTFTEEAFGRYKDNLISLYEDFEQTGLSK